LLPPEYARLRALRKLRATDAASNGAPSVNLTPSRSVNV
jgi:hypothetical protein